MMEVEREAERERNEAAFPFRAPSFVRSLAPRIKPLGRRIAAPEKRADPIYLLPAWRALMGRLIAERGRHCEDCGRTDCRIFGDHVVKLRDGGELLDPTNVRLL